jgi:hypothetical protein
VAFFIKKLLESESLIKCIVKNCVLYFVALLYCRWLRHCVISRKVSEYRSRGIRIVWTIYLAIPGEDIEKGHVDVNTEVTNYKTKTKLNCMV